MIRIYPPPSPYPLSNSQFLTSKSPLSNQKQQQQQQHHHITTISPPYHQQISTPPPPSPRPPNQKMLQSSPILSLFSLFFLTILLTLTSALPTPLSPTTSDIEIVAPLLQFLPQRAVPLTQGIETEMPMVIRREESSSTETEASEADCKFFEMWLGRGFG